MNEQVLPADPPAAGARAGCVVPALALLIAVVIIGGGLVVSTFVKGGTPNTFEQRLDQLVPGDVVFVSSRGLYLSRLASGEVLALDQNEARREDTVKNCVIRYRETLPRPDGGTGLFRSDCTGTTFALDGTPIEGPAPAMKRHPVTVKGDTVEVGVKTCTAIPGGPAVPCRPR